MQAPIQSSRAQSFDEIYGPPENFLEIEVCSFFLFFPFPLVPRVIPTCFVGLTMVSCVVWFLLPLRSRILRRMGLEGRCIRIMRLFVGYVLYSFLSALFMSEEGVVGILTD